MSEKIKTTYTKMQAEINPTEQLIQRTVSAVQPRKHQRPARLRTTALAATALVLLITLSIPVLAATNTGYALLYSVSPETAEFFRPINLYDESLGIRAEVESIHLVDDTIQIYLALQDPEGSRIDETMELCGNWGVTPSSPAIFKSDLSMAACSETFMGYNAETNTARYLLTFSDTTDKRIHSSDLLTLHIGRFFTGYTEGGSKKLSVIDLSDVSMDPETTFMPFSHFAHGTKPDEETLRYKREHEYICLKPAAEKIPVSDALPGIYFTGTGYIGNELHIQLYYTDPLFEESHGVLWLETADGEVIPYSTSTSTLVPDKKGKPIASYEEITFDITPDKLAGCTVYGSLRTCESIVDGDWQITFPLKETN